MWECRYCGAKRTRRQGTECPKSRAGKHDWVNADELAEERAKKRLLRQQEKEKRWEEQIAYCQEEARNYDLTSEDGWKWLETGNGQMWLRECDDGKAWIDSEDGLNWIAEKRRQQQERRAEQERREAERRRKEEERQAEQRRQQEERRSEQEQLEKKERQKRTNRIITWIIFILFALPLYFISYFGETGLDKIGFIPKLLLRIIAPVWCYFVTSFMVKTWSEYTRKRGIVGRVISTVVALFICIAILPLVMCIPPLLIGSIE